MRASSLKIDERRRCWSDSGPGEDGAIIYGTWNYPSQPTSSTSLTRQTSDAPIAEEEDGSDVTTVSSTSADLCCLRGLGQNRTMAVVVLFIAFLLDLMLLTAVDPVLPDIMHNLPSERWILHDDVIGNMTSHPVGRRTSNQTEKSPNDISPILLGFLNGAKPLTQVILNPFIGVLIDRIGHTIPMITGFLSLFTSTLGFAYAGTYQLLLVFRCCQGLSSSLLTIGGLSMVSDLYPDAVERGRALSYAFNGLTLGLIVGFPFGSLLYDFFGRQMPFLIMAALVAMGAVIRFCLMPVWIGRCHGKHKPLEEADEKESSCCSATFVFCDVYIVLASGAYFFLCYGIGAAMAIGPLYLIQEHGAAQWQIGVVFLVGAVSQSVFQYILTPFSHVIGWWLLALLGLFLVGIGVGCYVVASSVWVVLAPQSVYAAGIGFVMCSVPSLLAHLADIRARSQYGAVFALSDTGTNLGYFLGSTVTGILVEHFAYTIAFGATGLFVFMYGFVGFALRNVPEKYPKQVTSTPVRSEKKALLRRRSTIHASLMLSGSYKCA